MRRLHELRLLFCLLLPVLVSYLPHDGEGSNGKTINSSAAAGIGGSGPWDSQNMVFLGRLDLTELGASAANILGSDCWGWTDSQTGKEYAICGLTNATSFVDISDPTNPLYLGKLNTQTGNAAWRDMKVYMDHVYIVSDVNDNHGMQVFDLTELRNADPNNPSTFTNTTWYDDGTGSAHNIAINEDTGFAYINGSQHPQANGGLQVVDLSNPANPTPAGEFGGDGYTHDCQVVVYAGPDTDYTGDEIAFCCNEDTVTIVNVENKSNMFQISRNSYANDNYTHQGWLSEDHRYFYMGDELDEDNLGGPTRTHIFDCLDLDNPVYKGFYSGETNAIDHNLYVKDNLLYCGNYAAGLRVLEMDANDPSILDEVAFFDSYNTNNGTNFDGVWSVFPYFDSDVVMIMDRQNGLFLVKLSPIEITFPNGLPDMVSPNGNVEFQVQVSDFYGTAEPDSGVLHVDIGDGNGFQAYPMTDTNSNGLYNAAFPASMCGEIVNFYVSAESTDGIEICLPTNAPNEFYSALSANSLQTVYEDNFETDNGWTVSGDAADGQWNRGVPVGGGDRGDPEFDGDGSGQCFLTDNVDGNSDVDDGSTILTSPIIDSEAGANDISILTYKRWYSNDVGGNPAADIFVVDISNDGGSTWTNLETVGPDGSEISGGWISKVFKVSDTITPTAQMRLRFTASDLNGGSVVEAGVDGLEFSKIECGSTSPGESGMVTNLTHEWQTISLGQTYTDPVVVMGNSTFNGIDPVTVRVRNVTGTSFEVRIDEWDYLNGIHNAAEDVAFMVMESGVHTLADGTTIEAGKTVLDEQWKSLSFTSSFSTTPVILSQTMSVNGGAAVVTRHKNVGTSSFEVRLQEEQAANQVHIDEDVAWIAIQPGNGVNGSYTYEAELTGDSVTHVDHDINYVQSYGSAPLVFSSLQTFDGADCATMRGVSFDANGATVFMEEEKSADTEIKHTTEVLGYWIMTPGSIE